MKKFSLFIGLAICIIIGALFGYIYFHNHAFGTWGDDSAGYIYLWGRMSQSKPLVYTEPLTVKALDFFGDEKLARWTTPTHHEIISPKGYIASKYPIGLSLLMLLFEKVFNTDLAIYYVLPALAVASLIFIYLIADIIFADIKYKSLLSAAAALIVGFSTLYYEAAVSQPMREIPSIFFILAGYFFLLKATRVVKNKKIFYLLFVLSFLFFGFSVNIRETGVILFPAFLIVLVATCHGMLVRPKIKKILKLSILALGIIAIGVIPSIINSANITKYKEKFKKKDITKIAITSNFDHIRSFALSNLISNNGKYRPGEGGIQHYWEVMNNLSPAPYFMLLVVIGIIYMAKRNKWLTASLLWWVLSMLAIFSLWINPYSRYLLPAFPVLAIFAVYGLYIVLIKFIPYFIPNKKWQIATGVIAVITFLIVYQPALANIISNLKAPKEEVLIYKSIAESDLKQLKTISNTLKNTEKPLLIFTGSWQYGISETLEAHYGLQSIRMPLDQKFEFKTGQVKEFMDKNILPDYKTYVWLDTTTTPETREWLNNNYNLTEINKYYFTFEDQAIIYELTSKN
jgi:hypothetical protein